MGVLTFPQCLKPETPSRLHLIRLRSDASLFWGQEIVFLADIDSSETNFPRMLAQAAFWVRLVNRTWQTNECCLPIFWISNQSDMVDEWVGKCFLVYEENNHVRSAISFFSFLLRD